MQWAMTFFIPLYASKVISVQSGSIEFFPEMVTWGILRIALNFSVTVSASCGFVIDDVHMIAASMFMGVM